MHKEDWEKCWRFTNIIILLFKPFEILVRRSIRKGMERLLINLHINNPNILELGAGTGHDSAWLLKKFGGKATLIDNCDYIVSKSNKYFSRKKLNVTYLKSNIEDVKFKNRYDLVFSIGLIEHYYNKELYKIFKKHMEASKKNGYVMVFVPNRTSIYKFYRKLLTSLRLWMWDEKPFTIKDLKNLEKSTNSALLRTTQVICGMWIGTLYKKI